MGSTRSGFTLVELVIVIAIIGILAAIAIPRFIDLRTEAHRAGRDGIVGAVRSGILLAASRNQAQPSPAGVTFPPDLENGWSGQTGGDLEAAGTACVALTPCFELLMPVGAAVEADWQQTDDVTPFTYTFTNPVGGATSTFDYDAGTGTFIP